VPHTQAHVDEMKRHRANVCSSTITHHDWRERHCPSLLDEVLHHILTCRAEPHQPRERDLFAFLLVSRQWYRVVAEVIQDEVHRSEAPLYETPFDINDEILVEQLSVMRDQEWVIEPLLHFFRPRLLQPYRAEERAKRVINVHWTGPAYMAETMRNTLALILRFLEMTPGMRYSEQHIVFRSHENLEDQFQAAVTRVDEGIDNPFIILEVPLEHIIHTDGHVQWHKEDLAELMHNGRLHDVPFVELPPGTVLFILWTSHLAGYAEFPLRNLMLTQLLIEDHMEDHMDRFPSLQPAQIQRINSHLILFSNK
jgi:hypothetical protein